MKFKPWHKHAKWPPSDLTPWTLTVMFVETKSYENKNFALEIM